MNSKSIITAEIVIGLGYGDEGKGITTDYLCSQHPNNTCVVRFSGGQQAGHTVMLDDKKHIHSSFGSGTLRGVPSYFTEHTTFYPVTLLREYNILKSKGVHPTLILHPMAKMTTPFDVWANKSDKINCSHGTCGLGVGKTMERNLGPLKIYAIDLLDTNGLMNKIEIIGKTYNHINKDSSEFMSDLNEFLDSIKLLKTFVKIEGYNHLLKYDHLVFEGSQGIMLDMDHGTFPFVTYANTTSKNAHEVLDKLKVENRHLYYITRAYATRHGNGPFEPSPLKLKNNEEEINTFNKWQLEFKTGLIDYDKLMFALKVDGIYSQQYPHSLVVTCLDQIDIPFKYHKLEHSFHKIFESRSPFSKDFLKIKTF